MTDDVMSGLRTRARHLLGGLVRVLFALPGLLLVPLTLVSYPLVVVSVGILLLLGVTSVSRRYMNEYRTWAGQVLGAEISRPYLTPPSRGPVARIRTIATDPATWRDFGWIFVNLVASIGLGLAPVAMTVAGALGVTFPILLVFDADIDYHGIDRFAPVPVVLFVAPLIGTLYLAGAWWLTPRARVWHAQAARWLLAPTLARRVQELTDSRADTVDSQAAELRRIERDLHDGAQARLVALGMSLGMAEEVLTSDPAKAQELLAEARLSSSQALAELRDLVRGIHPPVLADRGLDGAVRAVALAGPLPVEVDIELGGRPQAPVESAAYFAVAEVLTNVAKHSDAQSAWVRIRHFEDALSIMVGDDGHGGAIITSDGGLRGIERRLAAFDGTLVIASPVGGPTIVTMELPCELSSAKTSSSSGTA